MGKAVLLFLLLLVLGGWAILRPGFYFIPPSVYEPEGVIIVYYEKPGDMPLFASPETLCRAQYGVITDNCLEAERNRAVVLSQRLVTRLPYANWAYDLFLPQR